MRDPVRAALAVLPAGLAALAEGAWVSVAAALIAAADHEPARLGVIGFSLAALAGLAAGRRFGSRPDWPGITVALTLGAAAAGWLVDPNARGSLAALDVAAAIGRHPAGWLAGVAFLRGSAHAGASSSQGAMETLLAVALPGLAVPVLLGGALQDPWRAQFSDDARIGIVVFLATATVGLGVARLAALRGAAGFDWRGNRAWLALLVVLVLGVSALSLPLGTLLGPVVQLAIAALLIPAVVLGTIAGFRQVSRRGIATYLLAWAVLVVVVSLLGRAPQVQPAESGSAEGAAQPATDSTVIYAVVGVVLVLVIVVGIVLLARLWSRDVLARRGDDVPEERWIDTREPSDVVAPRPGGIRRRRRRAPPVDAASAYLAALEALEASPATRRAPEESPAEHAARLRAGARGSLALDLLAADYELVRFGAVDVSPAEDRRAIGRWRRVREGR